MYFVVFENFQVNRFYHSLMTIQESDTIFILRTQDHVKRIILPIYKSWPFSCYRSGCLKRIYITYLIICHRWASLYNARKSGRKFRPKIIVSWAKDRWERWPRSNTTFICHVTVFARIWSYHGTIFASPRVRWLAWLRQDCRISPCAPAKWKTINQTSGNLHHFQWKIIRPIIMIILGKIGLYSNLQIA